MKVLINESQLSIINDVLLEYYSAKNDYANFIRTQLQKIYEPKGNWGKAPNPNDNCETGIGVINVFPHSDEDNWSILNRFDTNSKVKKEMYRLFELTNPTDISEKSFMNWIEENSFDLFDDKGKYTESLINLNKSTIDKGNQNEAFAVNILKGRFPNSEIVRFCAGDIRDTRKGIDIMVTDGGRKAHVQVKPFSKIASYIDNDGDTFFEVSTYMEPNKYSEKNVQIFMFVTPDNNSYVLFKNDKQKISQLRNHKIRFYEPPLYTNIEFEKTRKKRRTKDMDDTSQMFGVEDERLKNLNFRIDQLIKQRDKLLKTKTKEENPEN